MAERQVRQSYIELQGSVGSSLADYREKKGKRKAGGTGESGRCMRGEKKRKRRVEKDLKKDRN